MRETNERVVKYDILQNFDIFNSMRRSSLFITISFGIGVKSRGNENTTGPVISYHHETDGYCCFSQDVHIQLMIDWVLFAYKFAQPQIVLHICCNSN